MSKVVLDARRTPDTDLMSRCPDMIISKADAASLGFKVFRTGKPCLRGHTGWRYVSSGACVECVRSAVAKTRSSAK